jgi:hypothetical protein
MPFITDAQMNRYAIDPSQYPEATKMLAGFAKGKRTLVTYYRIINRESGNQRTNVADLSTMRNALDSEYQKISLLEITLQKGFTFTPNNAQSNGSLTGQALMLPNMNPNIGDIFLTPVGDGRIGFCRISKVDVANWLNDRSYAVEFVVQEFLDENTIAPIEASVTIRSVFSKSNYLGSTNALLSEETYLYLQDIQKRRGVLCRLFHQMFFDAGLNSYVRPDGIYDPWVVLFMNHKTTTADILLRPKNLIGVKPLLYNQTFWKRLEDPDNHTMYNLSPYVVVSPYNQTAMGVFVTELYGRGIIMPCAYGDDSSDTYVYSKAFYTNAVSQMTAEELLVYTAITARTAGDLGAFVTQYLDTVYALTPNDMFYKIPIYIHLIDMMLQSQYREADVLPMTS